VSIVPFVSIVCNRDSDERGHASGVRTFGPVRIEDGCVRLRAETRQVNTVGRDPGLDELIAIGSPQGQPE
jgi:hypothetical protein